MKISCVYKITNKVNNKIYIGSTRNYIKRITSHKNLLIKNKHPNSYLQNSCNKYGIDCFEFSIIENIEPQSLIKSETKHISLNKSDNREFGYNQQKPSNSRAGFEHSNSTKNKISNSMINKVRSEITKQQISQSMKQVASKRSSSSYKKMAKTKQNKPIPSLYKKVKCIELNKIYNSIKEAAKELELQRTGISLVLNGTIQSTGGYTFERVIDVRL